MNFESLANELILDVFEYFDGFHVLRSFYGLNTRLNQLLCHSFRSYAFDFRSISKYNFDLICQEYLPLIIDRVRSLKLSDDDETPNLPELFLSRDFPINQFIHLKSLSLYAIPSLDLLNQIIVQCRPLRSLKQLNIAHLNIDYEADKTTCLMNDIWSLALTHCRFENIYSGGECFLNIQVISTTMNYLSIDTIYRDFDVLYHIFNYTPALRQLSISSDHYSDEELLSTRTSSLHSLKLAFEGSKHSMITLLQNLPNLSSLTIKTFNMYLNGSEWEKLLVDYLPKIRRFRLRMNFSFPDDQEMDTLVDELLETFRTDFWIQQHQWFVQCDWDAVVASQQVFLYTLPYNFDDFSYHETTQSKSTDPNAITYPTYDRVHTLRHSFSDSLPMGEMTFFTARFSKINDLHVNLPFSHHFCSCIASIDQLKSLHVTIGEASFYQQLQFLLDRAPNLYSLTLRSKINLKINFMDISSASVRRLDLQTKSLFRLEYFRPEDCQLLTQSSIGKQCEVLLISVETRATVCELISMMSYLRSLTFQCKDDRCLYRESVPANDEVLQWLSEHLPSEFFIVRDKQQISKIHLWIQ